jgi:hypothetical protein
MSAPDDRPTSADRGPDLGAVLPTDVPVPRQRANPDPSAERGRPATEAPPAPRDPPAGPGEAYTRAALGARLTGARLIVGIGVLALAILGITPFVHPGGQDVPRNGARPASEAVAVAFGQRVSWPDGLAVTLSAPAPFRPSDSAFHNAGDVRFVTVTVTVMNGARSEIPLDGFLLTATADGAKADRVFDSANGIDNEPQTTIRPGGSVSYRAAFGTATPVPARIRVQATPRYGVGYEPTTFLGLG